MVIHSKAFCWIDDLKMWMINWILLLRPRKAGPEGPRTNTLFIINWLNAIWLTGYFFYVRAQRVPKGREPSTLKPINFYKINAKNLISLESNLGFHTPRDWCMRYSHWASLMVLINWLILEFLFKISELFEKIFSHIA